MNNTRGSSISAFVILKIDIRELYCSRYCVCKRIANCETLLLLTLFVELSTQLTYLLTYYYLDLRVDKCTAEQITKSRTITY